MNKSFIRLTKLKEWPGTGWIKSVEVTRHSKDISDWLALNATFDLVTALAARLKIDPNPGNSPNSVKTRVSATYPSIVIVKRGSPEKGGGTWDFTIKQ